MQLGRYFIVAIMICLFLQSCASTKMAEELQQAKETYHTGDFKAAIIQLLPLAVDCNAEAQYAVGYMYYNGYGVTRDVEAGLFWIGQSAAQGYVPAIKALDLIAIHKNTIPKTRIKENQKHSQEYIKQKRMTKKNDEHLDSFLKKPRNTIAETQPKAPANIIKTAAAITPVPPKYALQLFGSHELDTVKELGARLNLDDSAKFWQTKHNGKNWYILTYGNYTANYLAQLDKDKLPQQIKDWKPWVRKTEGLVLIG